MRTLAILFLAALQLMNGRSYAALASGGKSGDVPDSDRLLKKKGKKGKKKSKSPTASPTSTSGPTGSPFPTYNPTTTQYPTPVCNLPTKSNLFRALKSFDKLEAGILVPVFDVIVDGGLVFIESSSKCDKLNLLVSDISYDDVPGDIKLYCNITGENNLCKLNTPQGRGGAFSVVVQGNCTNVDVYASNKALPI